MGFMVVEAPPGEHQVRLAFVMPLENRVGWLLTGLSLLFLAALWGRFLICGRVALGPESL